jgi:hypothetical protein
MGQIAQSRGDTSAARARYREGLELFERLGMPEAEQVRQMIAALEGDEGQAAGPAAPPDPLRRLIAQARAADGAGDTQGAVVAQQQAVALAREAGDGREALVTLSVLLTNLAGYYGQAGRHDDAVTALEEVVALDERTAHPDTESDRQALEAARRAARMSPEERAKLEAAARLAGAGSDEDPLQAAQAAFNEQLAALPPGERAQMEAAMRRSAQEWAQMRPEERAQQLAAAQARGQRQQIESLADQARDGAIAALRGEIALETLATRLEEEAAEAAADEEAGSPWQQLAAYLRAVVALLRGDELPPVPAAYAAHLAAIRQASQDP